MRQLQDLQRAFFAGILDERVSAGAAAVYRRNVLANLHDALAAAYPVVRRLVGEGFFREAAGRHARAHPSTSGDLHRYGSGFAEFLESYDPARALEYLPDVARLEWAVAQAFHGPDPRPFDFEALGAIATDARAALRLSLQSAAHLVHSPQPILDIWEANQADRDGTPLRLEAPSRVLVHREGLLVKAGRLSPEDWRFLGAIAGGATLGEIAADPDLSQTLAGQLVRWTRASVIDGFMPCPAPPA